MKGFKYKSGKFRPTENKKGVMKSRDQTIKNKGVQLIQKRMNRDSLTSNDILNYIRSHEGVTEIDLDRKFDFGNNSDGSYTKFRNLVDSGKIRTGGWTREVHPDYSAGGSYNYYPVDNARMQREQKVIKLENRANIGIRAYTQEFYRQGSPLVLEIGTNVVKGKFIIEPYWKYYPLTEDQLETSKELSDKKFDRFEDAKDYVENKFGIKIELDKINSNDYQSWDKNIMDTEKELPIQRLYWNLPEGIRSLQRDGESIEQFLKRERITKPDFKSKWNPEGIGQ